MLRFKMRPPSVGGSPKRTKLVYITLRQLGSGANVDLNISFWLPRLIEFLPSTSFLFFMSKTSKEILGMLFQSRCLDISRPPNPSTNSGGTPDSAFFFSGRFGSQEGPRIPKWVAQVNGNNGYNLRSNSWCVYVDTCPGCGSKPVVPFWGRCTTHFRTYSSGDWDVHWGLTGLSIHDTGHHLHLYVPSAIGGPACRAGYGRLA